MHKHLSLLIIALLALIPAHAYDFAAVAPSGQTLYYTITGTNTVSVTYPGSDFNDPYNGYSTPTDTLTIPSSVTYNSQTYSVSSIGTSAFDGCTDLTSVTIPNSVSSIGNYAFYGCSGLTSVTIPNTVSSIGFNAFYLVRNVVYSGTASYASYNDYWGALCVNGYVDGDLVYTNSSRTNLVGCSSAATNVTIPISVTSVGVYVFSNCSGLDSISVTAGNITYDSRDNCNAIIKTSTNTLICGCKNTTIPNTVTSIGDDAFAFCSGLTSITIPNSVTVIGNEAFYYCTDLTSVIIPNTVSSIGYFTFYNCTSLTSVALPNSITSIDDYAFILCTGLTSITIPNTVTSIGDKAFYNCSGLTEITSLASVAPQLGSRAFSGVTSSIPVNIPCGSSASYNNQWSYFSNFIEGVVFSYSVTTNDTTMGTVQILAGPTCADPTVEINATPNYGYHLTRWSDGDTANPRTITLTQDTTLTAIFGIDTIHIEVSANEITRGYVTGTGDYEFGSPVTVTATAYAGYVFSKWSNDSTYNPYTFDALEDLTLTAIFVPEDTVGISPTTGACANITTCGARIIVANAQNQRIRLFDAVGRLLSTSNSTEATRLFDLPATGVYLVQVGNRPAQRVVAVKAE